MSSHTSTAATANAAEPTQPTTKLLRSLHLSYIKTLSTAQSSLSLTYHLTTHLRLNAVYWGLCATHLLRAPGTLGREELVGFVWECYVPGGGFAPFPRHDAHILPTLSALQVLAIRRQAIIAFILSLRQASDGSFVGDASQLENDTRFLYCAAQALSLLGAIDRLDREMTVRYLERCRNFDGGFGTRPGAESHAGQGE
ncbi:unnamed protein product [Tilletia controversa]|nr:unnamed protein product [Tilletia controversa]